MRSRDGAATIYKGAVVDCGTSTPLGAAFLLSGSEAAWVDPAFADRNDFIPYATSGRFSVSCDVYQYLRLTRTLVCLWDTIRQLATVRADASAGSNR